MSTKPHLDKGILVKIGEFYDKDKSATNKEILKNVNAWLKDHGYREISLSTVDRELAQHRKADKNKSPDQLEEPWSIGACLKYNIPVNMIPHLINEQKKSFKRKPEEVTVLVKGNPTKIITNPPMTIRQARWFSLLYPLVKEMVERNQNITEPIDGITSVLTIFYSRRERVAELLRQNTPDTSDLDELYFINENLDFVEGFINACVTSPEDQKQWRDAKEVVEEMSKQDKKDGE